MIIYRIYAVRPGCERRELTSVIIETGECISVDREDVKPIDQRLGLVINRIAPRPTAQEGLDRARILRRMNYRATHKCKLTKVAQKTQ
jgi:hypothetical protein